MISPIRRLARAWRRDGPIGFSFLVARNIQHYARAGLGKRHAQAEDAFDAANGTNTGGIVELGGHAGPLPNSDFAARYEASPERLVVTAIDRLGCDFPRYTFVDFGSGKGKVLLIAARYPFKRVIGVEFMKELHDTAELNLARLYPSLAAEGRVRSVCCDATQFDLPRDDLVCYFYNPFSMPVLRQIIDRLLAHRDNAFEVKVIYYNPRHRDLFEESGRFRVLHSNRQSLVLAAH